MYRLRNPHVSSVCETHMYRLRNNLSNYMYRLRNKYMYRLRNKHMYRMRNQRLRNIIFFVNIGIRTRDHVVSECTLLPLQRNYHYSVSEGPIMVFCFACDTYVSHAIHNVSNLINNVSHVVHWVSHAIVATSWFGFTHCVSHAIHTVFRMWNTMGDFDYVQNTVSHAIHGVFRMWSILHFGRNQISKTKKRLQI